MAETDPSVLPGNWDIGGGNAALTRLLHSARRGRLSRLAPRAVLRCDVLAFFLMLVRTKMVHGFFRLAALIVDEQKRTA